MALLMRLCIGELCAYGATATMVLAYRRYGALLCSLGNRAYRTINYRTYWCYLVITSLDQVRMRC